MKRNTKTLKLVSNFCGAYVFIFDTEELAGWQKDAENGLSYEKLVTVINAKHPRKIKQVENEKFVTSLLPICGTNTGSLSCSKSHRQSELMQYGPGVVVYFQTLKYIGWMFFWMTFLSLPAMAFYVSGNKSIPSDLKGAITAISLGNIGSSNDACNFGTYDIVNTIVTNKIVDYEATI